MKIYSEIFLLIIAVVILGYLFFHSANILLSPSTPQSLGNQVCFGQNCFSVELAKTEAEKEKGLMYRTQLDKDKGMLFIFNTEGVYPFWMKNTLIPLDMIWIGSNNKVVFIAQNVQPCKTFICPVINPKVKAKYVLEINAGVSEETGIKTGDIAELKLK
ncbi:MAG: DUF192 domain-containing protein [Candidatus Staskawiczbacteria bacterium]|jgi:uncharacterized membrane protein (UPF0127 family)